MQSPGNDQLRQFELRNRHGFEVKLLNYGATITSIRVPAPGGAIETVLGYPEASKYLNDPYYMGSTLGRYANRLANARLTINGRRYALENTPEQAPHCLHGGRRGFSSRFWQSHPTTNESSIVFSLESADGDQGFPGKISATISYSLLDDWRLLIVYRAVSDATTVVNLANHAYFNLNRDDAPIDNHHVMIDADHFTPVGSDMIPTGEMRHVDGTPFDFRRAVPLADRMTLHDDQLEIASGFDHNYVLNRTGSGSCSAARIHSPQSGLALDVHTTHPGLQLYTSQHLGQPFEPRGGICLEAQGFPNAPNTPGFPSTTLGPGRTWRRQVLYEFSAI